MKITCNIKKIVEIDRPGQGLTDLKQADFKELFWDFDDICPSTAIEKLGKGSFKSMKGSALIEDVAQIEGYTGAFISKCDNMAMSVGIAQLPYLPRDTKRVDLHDKIKELAVACMKVCGKIGCPYIIVRPLFAGIAEADLWEQNKAYYLYLIKEAKAYHITILLENQCKDVNGHLVRGICADENEALRWVDELNKEAIQLYGLREGEEKEYFGFCMNVGTCNLCGQNMYDFAVTLGDRIKAVILRDCDGHQENSLLPFTCANSGTSQTDWLNLIRGLRKISFDGILVLDFADTAAGFSPILKPRLMSLAKATADYFKWQIEMENLLEKYDSRVLFGAGNMCRNYMKNYGKDYPPLYTCDNTSALWGQQFEGLEIKNPEELKHLPENTVIFICNIYYREIEAQLRQMGVQNPIEFFNDEYMPTFHFQRMDATTRKVDKEDA